MRVFIVIVRLNNEHSDDRKARSILKYAAMDIIFACPAGPDDSIHNLLAKKFE